MKKLTAGIFTVLLGLCASNAADAAVASAKWVEQQLDTKVSSETYATDKATLESAIGDKVAQSDYDTKISALESADSDMSTYVGEIPSTATAKDIVGYIQEKTAGIATNTALEELTGRVAANETGVSGLQTLVGTTAVATQISNAITALNLGTTYATVGALNTTNENVSKNTTAIGENADAIAAVETLVGEKSVADQIKTASDALTGEINKKQDVLSGSDAIKVENNVVSIITGAITAAMLAENSVDTAQLVNGAVTADKIDDGAVTNDKILSVEQDKITGLTEDLAKKITEPDDDCNNMGAKCVLVYGTDTKTGQPAYAWEVIERGTAEQVVGA